ncbi:MAG: hydrogenase maturation protease [Candidatus Didemnitutus sp.]|nr:hydrogenase maturation protease [Candidatus Didemnitutus sp.]
MPTVLELLPGKSPLALPFAPAEEPVLILGVGNWIMGDEGVGIHVVRRLADLHAVPGVRVLDGGTGGINLLVEFDGVRDVVLVDATRDGRPAGTVTRLRPERVGDIPRGLGAHDFGLKDLFAAAALLGRMPNLYLFTIAVEEVHPMCTELSPPVAAVVTEVACAIQQLAEKLASGREA